MDQVTHIPGFHSFFFKWLLNMRIVGSWIKCHEPWKRRALDTHSCHWCIQCIQIHHRPKHCTQYHLQATCGSTCKGSRNAQQLSRNFRWKQLKTWFNSINIAYEYQQTHRRHQNITVKLMTDVCTRSHFSVKDQ